MKDLVILSKTDGDVLRLTSIDLNTIDQEMLRDPPCLPVLGYSVALVAVWGVSPSAIPKTPAERKHLH